MNLEKQVKIRLGLISSTTEEKAKIFSDEEITTSLERAKSLVQVLLPYNSLELLGDLIVHGAVVNLLGKQALTESGREYVFTSDNVDFVSPKISSILMDQWRFEYDKFFEKIKLFYDYEAK